METKMLLDGKLIRHFVFLESRQKEDVVSVGLLQEEELNTFSKLAVHSEVRTP